MVSRCEVAWLDTFHGDPCPIGSTLELWRNCNSHFTPPRYGHTTKISLHCYRVWSKMGRFSASLGRKLDNHRSPPLPKSLRIICVYTYNIFSRARIYCSYQIWLSSWAAHYKWVEFYVLLCKCSLIFLMNSVSKQRGKRAASVFLWLYLPVFLSASISGKLNSKGLVVLKFTMRNHRLRISCMILYSSFE